MEDKERKSLLEEIGKLHDRIAEIEGNDALSEALRESETKFRVISETIALALMMYQDNKWVYANKASSDITGYSNSEIIGMYFWGFVHPDYQKIVKSIGEKRQKNIEAVQSYEFKIICKSGEEKWVLLSGSSTTFNGKPAGIISVQDITDRKNAERDLKESEERFKFFTKVTYEGIVVHRNGVIIDANDAFLEMTGAPEENSVGENMLDFIPKVTDKAKVLMNIVRQKAKPYMVMAKRKDGSTFIAELEARNVKYGGKTVRITRVRDVSERQRIHEELKIANAQLGTMNSILRHDIANELAVMESGFELYRETSSQKMLVEIERRLNKCINIIRNQQKQATKFNEHPVKKVKFDLGVVLGQVIVDYPEIEVIVSGNANVIADETIYSVFDNLVSNSLKHGNATQIKIDVKSLGEFCEIHFADNGSGISDENKAKVFDEGYYFGNTGHTGIGLYIVQKAIESYGGEVTIEDNVPQGAIFVIRLKRVISK